ncbi:IS3 family transposase [Mycoplasma leonicaptivi]|uniref:IS3 family transposase n=1 Tax=Mycoplasma leonicaptivi TaxID=36742 RepID=UPI0005640417|nr:IS3 family transposase [Mycoplasma leonicaptivi]
MLLREFTQNNLRFRIFWFGIIKTELLNDLDYSEITFEELNIKIKEYVDWYNEERIQSNLEWKTPQQTAMML